jgi:hypothetical protein
MIFLQNRGPLCRITLQAILRWIFRCGRAKAPAGGPRRQMNAACARADAWNRSNRQDCRIAGIQECADFSPQLAATMRGCGPRSSLRSNSIRRSNALERI